MEGRRVREDVLIAKLRDMLKGEKDEDMIAAFEMMIAQLERQTWMRTQFRTKIFSSENSSMSLERDGC